MERFKVSEDCIESCLNCNHHGVTCGYYGRVFDQKFIELIDLIGETLANNENCSPVLMYFLDRLGKYENGKEFCFEDKDSELEVTFKGKTFFITISEEKTETGAEVIERKHHATFEKDI